jgi:hypothetical protein
MNSTLKTLRHFFSTLAADNNDSLETYLSRSSTLADLERRERQWHLASADRALFSIGVRSH